MRQQYVYYIIYFIYCDFCRVFCGRRFDRRLVSHANGKHSMGIKNSGFA